MTSALNHLHQVLMSGNRPSPARFREAIAECDRDITALLDELPPLHRLIVLSTMKVRCDIVGLQAVFETSEQTTAAVLTRVGELFTSIMQPDPTEDDDMSDSMFRLCEHCARRHVQLRVMGIGYCMRCADKLGIRPHGKIV